MTYCNLSCIYFVDVVSRQMVQYKLLCVDTSKKKGFRPSSIYTLVPVPLRTGTNVSISPGSNGKGAGRSLVPVQKGPLVPVRVSNRD